METRQAPVLVAVKPGVALPAAAAAPGAQAVPPASLPRVVFLSLAVTLACGLAGCVEDPATATTDSGTEAPPAGGGDTGTDAGGGTTPGGDGGTPRTDPPPVPTLAELGRALFHERGLSSGGNQSCADCHADSSAFADPDADLPVSEGSVAGRFGSRNTPTAMYAAPIPPLAKRDGPAGPRWSGGLFLDGRAADLDAQARAPLFNPLEMNLVDANDLLVHLRGSASRALFEARFGADSLGEGASADTTLTRVASAIAAFERTPAMQPATSKFDAMRDGRAQFSEQERLGMDLFVRRDKGDCNSCHSMAPGPNNAPTTFTNFRYENVGVPRNPDRRFYTADAVDTGLEATLLGRGVTPARAAEERGKFRVPTLRNVARTAPYMHNGVFSDLRTVIEFYSTRDTDPGRWLAIGAMEVPGTVERMHTGNRLLTAAEVDALVAFLETLTDGWAPAP